MKKIFLFALVLVGAIVMGSAASAQVVSSVSQSTPGSMPVSMPPMIKQPMLNIGPDGRFTARGMQVVSVSGNSFQGQVWGITYTINFTDSAPEFLNRGGAALSTSTGQLVAGDEVGVEGKITASSPLVVSGRVIRNYAISGKTRPVPPQMMRKEDGKGGEDGRLVPPLFMGGVSSSTAAFPSGQMMQRQGGEGESGVNQKINVLFKQIQDLQERMRKIQPVPAPAPAPAMAPSATQ